MKSNGAFGRTESKVGGRQVPSSAQISVYGVGLVRGLDIYLYLGKVQSGR